MLRGKSDERSRDAVHTGHAVELARLVRNPCPHRIQRLERGPSRPARLEVSNGRFGIGPGPYDDILQMRAQRDFDGSLVLRGQRNQLGDRSLDPRELARFRGGQHGAHTGVETGAALLDAFQRVELRASARAVFLCGGQVPAAVAFVVGL